MLVGEAPGESEDIGGAPFIGRAGEKLTELAAQSGLDLTECYITNAVKCRPPKNATPKISHIRACNKYLYQEIEWVKPKLIIALGLVAIRAITDKGNIQLKDVVGIRLEYKGIPVYATYHPAAVLRFGYLAAEVHNHITLALTGIRFTPHPTKLLDYGTRFPTLKCETGINTGWSPTARIVGYDIETYPGLDPWHPDARIRMYSVASRPGEAYVSMDKRRPIWLSGDWAMGSNIKFDAKWGRLHGCSLPDYVHLWDVKVAERLLDTTSPARGLKALALKYAPEMAGYEDEIHRIQKERGGWEHIRDEEMVEYSANDADASLRVGLAQMQRGGTAVYNQMAFYSRLIHHLVEVECRGMAIDSERLRVLEAQYAGEVMDQKALLEASLRCNVDSPQALAKVLSLPDTGKARLAKDQRPICAEILKYRKIKKLHSTYLKGFEKRLDKNSRIHTDFLVDGTDTGRLSSRDPNVQNIANVSDIKSMFVARAQGRGPGDAAGWLLVEMDFSQAEVWVAAYMSEDAKMLAMLKSGEDFHVNLAMTIFNKRDISQAERRAAKTITFQILYGGSAYGVAKRLGVPEWKAKLWIETYFSQFPKLARWQVERRLQAQEEGVVYTAYDRPYIFPPGIAWDKATLGDPKHMNPEAAQAAHYRRVAVNAPIQGTVGRLCQEAQMWFVEWPVVCQVHDSLIFESIGRPEDLKREVQANMSRFWDRHRYPWRIPVSVKVGKNWAEVT
jgi:DNA polymerase-1